MKKFMILALVAFMLFAVSTSFAATLDGDSAKAVNGAVIDATGSAAVTAFFKFSKSVYVAANTVATGYTVATAHTSGSKYYGTGYDATAIFVKDAGGNVADTLATPSSSAADEAFTTADSWSTL